MEKEEIMKGISNLMQHFFNPKPFFADCPHCKKQGKRNILKYRGSDKYYFTDIMDLQNYTIDPRLVDHEKYIIEQYMTSGEAGSYGCITFVACDGCIYSEHIPFFNHYPDGWEMTVFKTKRYGPFENMNL